jgi:hypothetical protein
MAVRVVRRIAALLRTLWDSTPFTVFGPRTYRFLALCIGLNGTVLFGFGHAVHVAGTHAVVRYEQPGGKFIRALSARDRHYFLTLRRLRTMGAAVRSIGILVQAVACVFLFRPVWLYLFLKICRLER